MLRSDPRPKHLLYLCAGVFVAWLIAIGVALLSADLGEAGSLGDAVGILNALFSGLAFAALIFALWLQFRELRLQRRQLKAQLRELSMNTEELRRSAAAQEGIMKLQAQQTEALRSTALLQALNNQIESYEASARKLANADVMDHEAARAEKALLNVLADLKNERSDIMQSLRAGG